MFVFLVGIIIMFVGFIGVLSQHRKQGYGSLLVNSLLSHVSGLPSCLAVYLHVQASNVSAQQFYNQLVTVFSCGYIVVIVYLCRVGFREFMAVPNYYCIDGRPEDAFLYCCFTNGGVVFPNTVRAYAFRYYEDTVSCLMQSCTAITFLFKRILNIRRFLYT